MSFTHQSAVRFNQLLIISRTEQNHHHVNGLPLFLSLSLQVNIQNIPKTKNSVVVSHPLCINTKATPENCTEDMPPPMQPEVIHV